MNQKDTIFDLSVNTSGKRYLSGSQKVFAPLPLERMPPSVGRQDRFHLEYEEGQGEVVLNNTYLLSRKLCNIIYY